VLESVLVGGASAAIVRARSGAPALVVTSNNTKTSIVFNIDKPVGNPPKLLALESQPYLIDKERIYVGKTAVQKVQENPLLMKNYAKQMQDITKMNLNPRQQWYLKLALRSEQFRQLPTDLADIHRANFKSSLSKLRVEWEQNTGQKWPVYKEKVYHKSGILARNIGEPYDGHHIIQANHGGPNTWWNMKPSHISDHQKIHGKNSAARKIFNNTKKD
jgi:5-methylcytosine-specific restriction endonuclease McrA